MIRLIEEGEEFMQQYTVALPEKHVGYLQGLDKGNPWYQVREHSLDQISEALTNGLDELERDQVGLLLEEMKSRYPAWDNALDYILKKKTLQVLTQVALQPGDFLQQEEKLALFEFVANSDIVEHVSNYHHRSNHSCALDDNERHNEYKSFTKRWSWRNDPKPLYEHADRMINTLDMILPEDQKEPVFSLISEILFKVKRTNLVMNKFKGNNLTIVHQELKFGDHAEEFGVLVKPKNREKMIASIGYVTMPISRSEKSGDYNWTDWLQMFGQPHPMKNPKYEAFVS